MDRLSGLVKIQSRPKNDSEDGLGGGLDGYLRDLNLPVGLPPLPPPGVSGKVGPAAPLVLAFLDAHREGPAPLPPKPKAPGRSNSLEKEDFRDVGEKIGMARKDLAGHLQRYAEGVAVALEDLTALEVDPALACDLITREQQLGTRERFLHELRDAGMEPGAAYVASRLYRAVAKRPGDSPEARENFLRGTTALKAVVSQWSSYSSARQGMERLSRELNDFFHLTYLPGTDLKVEELHQVRNRAWSEVVNRMRDGEILGSLDALRRDVEELGGLLGTSENYPHAVTARGENALKNFLAVAQALNVAREAALAESGRYIEERKRAFGGLGSEFLALTRSCDRRQAMFQKAYPLKTWDWAFKEAPTPKVADAPADTEPARKPRYHWVREVPENADRVGGQERIFVAETLMEVFGFRGIEYGNWQSLESAKAHTQAAGEALLDLAQVLGVPAAEVSLGGRLALAFGARGSGKFSAHYEAGLAVINLTKTRGGGYVGHEFGHGVDNHLAALSTGYRSHHQSFVSNFENYAPPGNELPVEVGEALKKVHDAVYKGGKVHRGLLEVEVPPTTFRPFRPMDNALKQFNGDVEAILDSTAESLDRHYPGVRSGDGRAIRSWNATMQNYAQYLAWKVGRPLTIPQVLGGGNASDFVKTGKAMGEYWGRPQELFARAWEAFLWDELQAQGRKNTYLVSGSSEASAQRFADDHLILEPQGKTSIFPRGEERIRINEAIGALVKALREHAFTIEGDRNGTGS